ncbi:RNA polymerase sigma factor [Terriglobus tenax]|uniref:RNA polymerase sigma factor n=1 Tax=Terriglobus tenax TaxID=1111115 RepID=UPI0021DF67AC|nr:sigma-70 family RNA polymerase sigma factor [Terriglobus tenax]
MNATASTAILSFAARQEARTQELEDIDALVRLYRAKVYRYVAYAINDTDLAESITQDCFVKAYANRASFRGDCSVSTWLMSIATNLVRDQVRTQKFKFWRNFRSTAADVTDMAHQIGSRSSSPESALIARERVKGVHAALATLSERQRSVFVMRFLEEMDLAEIAQVTGMPVNTVKTHLHRAVTAIRAQLGPNASTLGGPR